LLSAFLRPTGLRIIKYSSATEFLEQFQDDLVTPRCLVLDVCMETIGGIELQRRLNSHGIRLPIIFVSGASGVPEAVSVMKDGAADFLQKPVDRQRFKMRLHLIPPQKSSWLCNAPSASARRR